MYAVQHQEVLECVRSSGKKLTPQQVARKLRHIAPSNVRDCLLYLLRCGDLELTVERKVFARLV